ncbi:MAG: glycosyltransferase family 4 protein [Nitrospira sp.]|nr:glycosyltransferase family 4 protein [Nitrospira sp.]
MSFDVTWLIHRVRVALGMRGPVPRPEPLSSQVGESASLNGRAVGQHGPIKALVFSHNLDFEGASISLNELVVGLFHQGVSTPEIVAFRDGPLRAKYESQGISVQVVPGILHKVSTLTRLSVEVDRLALRIQEAGAGLVLVNTLLNFPAVLAAEHAGVPSVWIVRESEPWDQYFCFLPDPVAQRAIAAVGLPRKVVFVAHATRKVWDAFDKQHSFTVVHNGINLDRFPLRNDVAESLRYREVLGVKPDSIAILCVGTLCDRKSQMDLVEAFAVLPDAISRRVQILLVGDDRGTYADGLKKRCHALPTHSRNRIRIVPPTESIASFYAAADLFVLSSKVESFPRVVLEAMAFGLPIITTPVFGVREQVVEGENALFYPPGDSRLLARQIEYLVCDDARRLRMAERSRGHISQMTTFNEMVAAYASISREAVS